MRSIISGRTRPYLRLLALSSLTLFLELMVIRWAPGVVRLIAYYTNLLLISSFLGLGIGALCSKRRRLLGWFPVFLLLYAVFLFAARNSLTLGSILEFRFFAVLPQARTYVILVLTFVLNALVFAPLGQQIGQLFDQLPNLEAYSFDLAGSLCGTVVFGLFAFFYFSPVLGILAVMVLTLVLMRTRERMVALPFFALTVLVIMQSTEQRAIWSPYYFITVRDTDHPTVVGPIPPSDLRTRMNPPIYGANVNQDFYQFHGSFDLKRYTPDHPRYAFVREMRSYFQQPHLIHPNARRVAIIGAGGGVDVEAALLAGAEWVDAVDIDPVLVRISNRYNSSNVYADPRVHVQINDARAFFHKAPDKYDLVVFGFLDSQALSSAMSNIRLDSYVYTAESMHEAFGLLNETGTLTMSFSTERPWLMQKLTRMMRQGTGREPTAYSDGVRLTLVAQRQEGAAVPEQLGNYRRVLPGTLGLAAPTDDWPYLYLAYQTIPEDYLIVIGSLLLLSIIAVLLVQPQAIASRNITFAALGMGFLLLQTKSIIDCALYFGATWLVTTVVVSGVLLMVLAANIVAARLSGFREALFLPLFAALILLYFAPRQTIVSLPVALRIAWTVLVVPLPIFFAGLIFSTLFRDVADASIAFGANLMGAMIGGFAEYTGMIIGNRQLLLLVMVAYLIAFLSIRWRMAPHRTGLSIPSLVPRI